MLLVYSRYGGLSSEPISFQDADASFKVGRIAEQVVEGAMSPLVYSDDSGSGVRVARGLVVSRYSVRTTLFFDILTCESVGVPTHSASVMWKVLSQLLSSSEKTGGGSCGVFSMSVACFMKADMSLTHAWCWSLVAVTSQLMEISHSIQTEMNFREPSALNSRFVS